ncbi:MAG: serine/threonine protein kinase [Lachnospiraceae bacterium]|nr:serine/threonine protein kinase [Lachnospiraceae bacterium]
MNAPGRILNGRYQLVEQIGRGGSGSVFLARDIFIRKLWAVKFLSNDSFVSERMSINEKEVMEALDHPAFPRIVDAFSLNDGYYIVSDYIEGTDLRDYLKNERPPLRQKCRIAIKLLEALSFLHTREEPILYLDLKPENVMITRDGDVKLIDFGVAGRIMKERRSSFGTKGYAAPEQYVKAECDQRTDIFAFGMLFYSMLSLCDPNEELERQRRMIRMNNSIPRAVKKIILKCTSGNKEGRFTDAKSVERQIRHYLLRPKRIVIFCVMLTAVLGPPIAFYIGLGSW